MIRRSLAALDDGQFRRDLNDEGRLSGAAINDALSELNLRRNVAKTLGNYYQGQNNILGRKITEAKDGAPDNRIPIPYARKIITTITGYMYKPGAVQFSSDNEPYFELLKDVFWDNGEQSKTARLGKLSSIFGVAYEIHYVDEQLRPRFATVPVEDFLPVYSNDIEPELVAGVHRYIENLPGEREQNSVEHIDIYYADAILMYSKQGVSSSIADMVLTKELEHGYGMVPVAVYRNNDEIAGDYEHIEKLLDAYDVLMSDSMNEFDRFAWAYLVLKNLNMSKDDIESVKVKRVFEVMENGGVEFLTKDIQTAFIEFMRGWIREEIHKQTHIPDMADEQFAGQQSGIAIRYKLSDMENLASTKEIGFREGLRRRLDLLNAFWRTQGINLGDTRDVAITFNRNIPANYLEQAQIVGQLRGHVSHKTLLDEVVTFVDDAQGEMEALAEEQDALLGGFSELQEEEAQEEPLSDGQE